MADITKCKGINCPIKDDCYRYTAKDSDFLQAYFVDDNVGEKTDDGFECEYFWNANKLLWNTNNLKK